MMTIRRKLTFLFVLSLLSFLAGCEQPTPILVFVTPTPVPQIGAISTPTETTQPTTIPTVAPLPTGVEVSPTIQAASPAVSPTAGATYLGPVIGPDYTLPPTSTPGPSDTPEPTDTPEEEEEETPLPPPTDTPLPGPTPTALPDLDSSRMGIQLDPNLTDEDWNNAASGRVNDHLEMGWIKVQLSWKQMQPNGPDDFGDFFQLQEQHLKHADAEGFNILVSIAKAPAWARSNQTEDGPPDNPQALVYFLNTWLLAKAPFIDAIEIWNEPNLQREWQGGYAFNGAGYMQLFAPAYQAIKSFNPNIIVVTSGLAPTGNNPGSRDDRAFLREMYGAGLAQYDAAIGVHPYSWANSPDAACCGTRGWDDNSHFFFAETMRAYRDTMNANGDGNAELWVTEFGWASWDGLPGDPPEAWMGWVDKWQQGNYIIRAFQIGQQTQGVGPMILWNLNFAVLGNLVEQRDERAAYSLVVPLQPQERPAYWMLYDAVRPDEQLPRYD